MTTTPPPDGQPGPPPGPSTGTTQVDDGPRVTRDEVRDLGRLRRTTGGQRNIAGVAGGLGRHLDIDPVILRVAFVVLAFFGGAGILLYGAAWLLVPDDAALRPPLGLDERSRTVALWIAAGIGAAVLLGASLGDGVVPFPVILVAGIALLVVLQVNKKKAGPGGVEGSVTLDKQGLDPSAAAGRPFVPGPPAPYAAGWVPPAPRDNPRKRGPRLFWFTAALCALGLGALGLLDAAGVPVAGPTYPGLVVAVVGAMLVLGAFWGRAGGLVMVGLVASVVLAASITAQEVEDQSLRTAPTAAADVRTSYTFGAGELVLDLRDVGDPAALAGRTIRLDGDLGHIEVIVPVGLPVEARAAIDGPGGFQLFDVASGGFGTGASSTTPPSAPTSTAPGSTQEPLVIDAHLEAGAIDIQTHGSTR